MFIDFGSDEERKADTDVIDLDCWNLSFPPASSFSFLSFSRLFSLLAL